MQPLYIAIIVLASYLVGSLSFAVIVSRVMGLSDPRTYGSGNPGATNVLRSGSKKAAIATLLLDALKGFFPVLFVQLWGDGFGFHEGTAALVGLAAFVGHVWPVFFGFKGGKGVATAAGVLFAFNAWLGVGTLLSWVIVAAFFRYSSLAAIVSAAFAPFYYLLIWGADWIAMAIAVMSLLLIWRHGSNIRKLLAGTESKIGSRSKAAAGEAAKPKRSRGHGGARRHHHHHHHHKEAKNGSAL